MASPSGNRRFPVRVAVVGAGAAGLAALRHLQARPEHFRPVAFEQSNQIGGTWAYTDRVGADDNGLPIHSSIYKGLVYVAVCTASSIFSFRSYCFLSYVLYLQMRSDMHT